MKKIFIALSMLTLLYTSCNPSTDDVSTGFMEQYDANSVDAKVTPVVVNGKNSNRLVIENHSQITSQWSAAQLVEDDVTSCKSYDTICVTKLGANTVTLHCKNIAVDFTKDFTVNVDEITYLTGELMNRLCVDGTEGNYKSTISGFEGQTVQFGTSFDASKVKITQEVDQESGLKGNVFKVANANGVLSDWSITKVGASEASGTASLNGDQLMVVEEGDFKITLNYTKADGTTATYDAGTFNVATLSTKPELLEYLAGGEDGDGTTEWVWNDAATSVWGNGPFGSGSAPQWWGVAYADINAQAGNWSGGVARSGQTASFVIDTNTNTITNGDGTSMAMKVSVLDHQDASWDLGSITIAEASGTNFVIPMGVNVNQSGLPFQKYYVLKASDDKLVLTAAEQSGSGTGWFYVFKKKTE